MILQLLIKFRQSHTPTKPSIPFDPLCSFNHCVLRACTSIWYSISAVSNKKATSAIISELVYCPDPPGTSWHLTHGREEGGSCGEGTGLGFYRLGFNYPVCHRLPVWCWALEFIFLCLGSLSAKWRYHSPTSQECCEDKPVTGCQVFKYWCWTPQKVLKIN